MWRDLPPMGEMGGWNESYEVFALRNDRQLTSIIGVMGMHFLFGGVEHEGVQLGAVATLPRFSRNGVIAALNEPGSGGTFGAGKASDAFRQ